MPAPPYPGPARRASLLHLTSQTTDPTADPSGVIWYVKKILGIGQLFARTSDGRVNQISRGFVPVIDAGLYGINPDGVTDSYAGFMAALAECDPVSGRLWIPYGNFAVSKAPIADGFERIKVRGAGKIIFPSDDASLTGAGYDNDPINARSGIYFRNCTNPIVQDLKFEGRNTSSASPDVRVNIGHAVACHNNVPRLRMYNCEQYWGGGLVHQLAGSTDAVVKDCYSYASRSSSRLGDRGIFENVTWELPFTAAFDRVGNNGSTHSAYQYASSGQYVQARNCHWINIREDGFKVSGSASPLRGYAVIGGTAHNCGWNSDGSPASGVVVLAGADDNNLHTTIQVDGLQTFDCRAAVQVLGATNVKIRGIQCQQSVVPSVATAAMIDVTQYTTTSQPVEDVDIRNCTGNYDGASGATVANNLISVTRVGKGISGRSSNVVIEDNASGNGYGRCVTASDCYAPGIRRNTSRNGTSIVMVTGSRMARIMMNDIIDQRSDNAMIRLKDVAWPIIGMNWGAGKLYAAQNAHVGTSDNNNSTATIHFPFGGLYGRAVSSFGQPEIVLAYGDGIATGDTLNLNGTIYTFGTDFTDFTTLVALLNGLSNFRCHDYGTLLPGSPVIKHFRVRWATASPVANKFFIETNTVNKNALVTLRNASTSAGSNRCLSRGEGTNQVVIWSPCLERGRVPQVRPENQAAQVALALGMPYPVYTDEANEVGASCTLQFAPTADLTGAVFQWSI